MFLYHYYDSKTGPFRSISDLSVDEAKAVLEEIKNTKPNSQRYDKYVQYRRNCEAIPTLSDSITDGREYRKQLYTYKEILDVIEKYGLPQNWNDDGKYGPERYIEVHVWSDDTIKKYEI